MCVRVHAPYRVRIICSSITPTQTEHSAKLRCVQCKATILPRYRREYCLKLKIIAACRRSAKLRHQNKGNIYALRLTTGSVCRQLVGIVYLCAFYDLVADSAPFPCLTSTTCQRQPDRHLTHADTVHPN